MYRMALVYSAVRPEWRIQPDDFLANRQRKRTCRHHRGGTMRFLKSAGRVG
jgi:hypothetical protein